MLTSAGALDAFEPIASSARDTCETQRAVARHNSAYDSIKKGKAVSYRAACEEKKPKPEPKVS